MSADMPARSTPQLDLMRRLRVRDAEHPAMSFLDDSERERVDRILESSVEKGLTKKVQREAHAFLVTLGQRDASLGFLNEAERVELNRLVSFNPPPASSQKKQVHSPKRSSSMSAVVNCAWHIQPTNTPATIPIRMANEKRYDIRAAIVRS